MPDPINRKGWEDLFAVDFALDGKCHQRAIMEDWKKSDERLATVLRSICENSRTIEAVKFSLMAIAGSLDGSVSLRVLDFVQSIVEKMK